MSQEDPGNDSLALRIRVAQIRYDVNWQGTAIKMQQERLAAYVDMPVEQRMYMHMQAVVDLDFLVISARRLLRVAERTKSLGLDLDGELKQSIKIFTSRWLP